MPTSTPMSAELLSQNLGKTHSTANAAVDCNQSMSHLVEAASDGTVATTVLRCAQLGRFLI